MSIEVTRLDSIEAADRNSWNHVVGEASLGSVHHRYEWLRAVEAGTRYEPRHLVATKKDNPVGVFPHFVAPIEKVPFHRLVSDGVGTLGPAVLTDENEVLRRFLETVPDLCTATVITHTIKTHGMDFIRYHDLFEEYGYDQIVGSCYLTLDLTDDWETIRESMHSSRRRAIDNGHDQSFTVVDDGADSDVMAEFYEGYSSVVERVGARRIRASFFRELSEFPERVKVFSLSVDGEDRGKLLFLLDDERSTLHYKLSAVTDEDFAYNASELIHEHAIKWGIENGYDTYNFGGTPPDLRDGLFQFKEKFGAQPRMATAWERGYSKLLWPAFSAGRSLYRRLEARQRGES